MANTAVDERHLVWWHGCAEEADYQSFFLPPPSVPRIHSRKELNVVHCTQYTTYMGSRGLLLGKTAAEKKKVEVGISQGKG